MIPMPFIVAAIATGVNVVYHISAHRKQRSKFKNNGMTALQLAVSAQDLKGVKDCLSAGSDACERDRSETPTLIYAAKTGNCELIKILIEHGARVNAMDNDGRTALFYVPNDVSVKCLVENGALVDAHDIDGKTPLFFAQTPEIVKQLFLAKASAKAVDGEGNTALFFAQTPEIAIAMLDGGINVLAQNNAGQTAVSFVQNDDVRMALLTYIAVGDIERNLIDKFVKELDMEPRLANWLDRNRNPLLKTAIFKGRLDAVKALIAHGADVNVRDAQDELIIFDAVASYRPGLVTMMCEAGALVNETNKSNKTTLRMAFIHGQMGALEELVIAGVNVNVIDENGRTPLCYVRHGSLVELMVSHGADPNAVDPEGKTPIFYATSGDVVDALVRCGADINAKDNLGNTALFYAKKREIICALLSCKADIFIRNNEYKSIFELSNSRILIDELYEYMRALVSSNNTELLMPLLADPIALSLPNHNSLLFDAVEIGNVDCVELFLMAGANLNVISTSKQVSLAEHAVKVGNAAVLRLLVKAGMVVNYRQLKALPRSNDHKSLQYAGNKSKVFQLEWRLEKLSHQIGDPEILQILKDAGLCVSHKDEVLRCANPKYVAKFLEIYDQRLLDEELEGTLIRAIEGNDIECLERILSRCKFEGGYSNSKSRVFKLFLKCVQKNNLDALKLIFDKAERQIGIAEKNGKKNGKKFIVEYYAWASMEEFFSSVLRGNYCAFADFMFENGYGLKCRALIDTIVSGSPEMVDVIVRHISSEELEDTELSLLYWAAKSGSLDKVKSLMAAGANLFCRVSVPMKVVYAYTSYELDSLLLWSVVYATDEICEYLFSFMSERDFEREDLRSFPSLILETNREGLMPYSLLRAMKAMK